MKAIQLKEPGFANLQLTELPTPRPGTGEVLVRLQAASLNYLDMDVALGQFPGVEYPIVPVADGAGDIAAVGSAVPGFAEGDAVIPHFMPAWAGGAISAAGVSAMRGVSRQGSLAQYVVVPAASLVRTPKGLTAAEAATLPIAATTAWNALKAGSIRPGRSVLLLGTGGVSVFALQFAKAAGAEVIITSSSDAKLARVRTMGADHTINYRSNPDWEKEVLDRTAGRGVDLVIESGGAGTFVKSLSSVTHGGTVFVIGFVTGLELQLNLLPIIVKAVRVQGNNTGSVDDLREAARAIQVNGIKPVVDRVFDSADAARAYEAHAQASHFGKLAISLTDLH